MYSFAELSLKLLKTRPLPSFSNWITSSNVNPRYISSLTQTKVLEPKTKVFPTAFWLFSSITVSIGMYIMNTSKYCQKLGKVISMQIRLIKYLIKGEKLFQTE